MAAVKKVDTKKTTAPKPATVRRRSADTATARPGRPRRPEGTPPEVLDPAEGLARGDGRFKDFDRAGAIEAYKDVTRSLADVAEEYGISPARLHELVRINAPELLRGPCSVPPVYDHDAAIADFKTGKHSYRSLGKKYEVSHNAIAKMLKRRCPELVEKILGQRNHPNSRAGGVPA